MAEDEGKVGQVKADPPKAKVAAATIPPTREDELVKQLKISAAPNRYPGGPGLKLGISCESHKGLLQMGYDRWSLETTPKYLERRF